MQIENPELVSIVVPAHNEERHIRQCLVSLKRQTYPAIEIIVADNGSTDDTARIAEEGGVIVVSEPIPGVCAARQRGTDRATGTIIVSTDADTVFSPTWIQTIVETFQKDPNIVAVGGTFLLDEASPWWGRAIFAGIVGIIRIVYKITGRPLNLFGSNTAFKRDAFEGYDIRLHQGGDEVVLLRQLRKKGRVVFLFDNPVVTSSRRLEKGFLHFMIFYVFDYFYSIATGKSMVEPRAVRLQKEHLSKQ